jgi:hypothetical protein
LRNAGLDHPSDWLEKEVCAAELAVGWLQKCRVFTAGVYFNSFRHSVFSKLLMYNELWSHFLLPDLEVMYGRDEKRNNEL